MSFDLEHLVDLAVFARVVESRSFSEAARRSGIAKSAVSRRVARLEERLGVQLLRRTTRHLQVTSEGARFHEHCAQMLASARAAEDAVAGSGSSLRGEVRLNAPVTFAHLHLTRALAAFQLEHPEVSISLSTEDRLVDVVSAEVDLVIRIARLQDASFVARRLAADRLVVVGAPAYLDRHGRPQTPEDLVHHNCLHYELVPRSAEWKFRGQDGEPVGAPRGNFSATDGAVLREAALAGLGLAVVPSFMVAAAVTAGQLELLLDGHRRAEVGIHAVMSSARGVPLRVRTLVDFLVRRFAQPTWRATALLARSR